MPMPSAWSPPGTVRAWLRNKYTYDPLSGGICLADGTAPKLQVASNGYLQLKITNLRLGVRRYVSAHRLAWFLHNGAFPVHEIDHIDHVKTNNRISNLREATRAENHANGPKKHPRRGGAYSSKYRGVSWSKKDRRWVAMIRTGGRTKYIGQFRLEDDAACAYNKTALTIFGEFANLNEVPFQARLMSRKPCE